MVMEQKWKDTRLPDERGHYGPFGGRYVPETLMTALMQLEREYNAIKKDPDFREELDALLGDYAGRPTPLYRAQRLENALETPAHVYLKREDLCHTGAHKINNTLGQGLLARRLGKTRLIAETGAGQHGVATATVAALLGMQCDVFMGTEDMERQRLNVFRMEMLGTRVIEVTGGTATLKDATNEALRDWLARVDDTHYIIGSVVGPHPFPMMVRDFQAIIGRETREQLMEKEGKLPDYLIACVGGGSNSLGLFHPFFYDDSVKFVGVEAAGNGILSGKHAASLLEGEVGVFHGSKSYVLQTDDGQIKTTHSISAGLDYPGVGPEHSFYKYSGRAEYVAATDEEALEAVKILCKTEGILPALESAHAFVHLKNIASDLTEDDVVVICLSGRGDKDVEVLIKKTGFEQ